MGRDSLDALFSRFVRGPLGLETMGFRAGRRRHEPVRGAIAPTETVERRPGPLDYLPRLPERPGVPFGGVHDDNAAAMGGTAGHAGLFSHVWDVWKVMVSLRRAYLGRPGLTLIRPETVRAFWEYEADGDRALGFDRAPGPDSWHGRRWSAASVGHLGYTGTSVCYDPRADLTAILLTNRVHPTAANLGIRRFRPLIHDLAAEAFGGPS